ncbi:MAG: hypothetical protein D6681_16430 [Calditrichaeota bacterium]|nr:MAG: hypothetical protein D6681_16430 [Calditrichota bacterium]
MKVRFQADADLNQIIVKATLRREPRIDFQTAQAAGLSGLKDEDVLAIAARERRILVTHDRRTIPHHFANFILSQESPEVLIVPQKLPVANVVEELILIWYASEAEEWKNRIHSLPL